MKKITTVFLALCCLLWGGFAYPCAYAAEPIKPIEEKALEDKAIEDVVIDDLDIYQGGAAMQPDGTFILAGSKRTEQGTGVAMAVSVSPFGEINWTLMDDYNGRSDMHYTDVCALDDGGIFTNFSYYSGGEHECFLNRIDHGVVTSRTDLEAQLSGYLYGAGNAFIVSRVSKGVDIDNRDNFYYHTYTAYDSQQQVNWSLALDIPFRLCTALPAPDGCFLLGTSPIATDDQPLYEGYIIKIDLQGNILWQQAFPGSSFEFNSGVVLEDGSLVATGGTQVGDSSWDSVIVQMSGTGELLGRKDHHINNSQFCTMVAVEQGYLAAGISHELNSWYINMTLMSFDGEILKQWIIGEDGIIHESANLFTSPYGTYLISCFRYERPDEQNSENWVDKVLIQKIDLE